MPGTKLHREHILASSFLVRSFFSTFCEGPGLVWYLYYPGMKVGVTSLQDNFKWLHKADLKLSKVAYSNCTALCYGLILNTHGTSQRYTSILHWHWKLPSNLQTSNVKRCCISHRVTGSPTSGITHKVAFIPLRTRIPQPLKRTFHKSPTLTQNVWSNSRCYTYRLQ